MLQLLILKVNLFFFFFHFIYDLFLSFSFLIKPSLVSLTCLGSEFNGNKIAAFVIEPIQGEGI
jgi:hypothetical protein